MTENERLDIVKRINKKKETNKKILKNQEELKYLLQSESVKKYLKLQEELESLKQEQKYFTDSEEKIIELEFEYGIKSISSCKHDIWLYDGSYSIETNNPQSLRCREVKHDIEQCNNFDYNKYVCLECGKNLKEHDWQIFENVYFVLNSNKIIDINYYRNLYKQLLFNNPVPVAQNILITEYNKEISNNIHIKKIKK